MSNPPEYVDLHQLLPQIERLQRRPASELTAEERYVLLTYQDCLAQQLREQKSPDEENISNGVLITEPFEGTRRIEYTVPEGWRVPNIGRNRKERRNAHRRRIVS